MHRQPPNSLPPLVQALQQYDRHNRRRFHVPAHAGQSLFTETAAPFWADPFRFDLTELDGLDVLSEPSGAILESQRQIANLFGVAHSFMLVNGASVGLAAAMLSVARPGDKVLVARNAHRAVLSGLILAGAEPVWFLPQVLPEWGLWGAMDCASLEAALQQHPDAKAVFITSPTYEGIGSPIAELSAVCKKQKLALIVDEAHGSLWPLSEQLPQSACQAGADVVIHSLHKSGGSLTQSALAHLPSGSCVDAVLFQQALNTLQTTSPSYLLMASLDAACAFWASEAGQTYLSEFLLRVRKLRANLESRLLSLRLFHTHSSAWDYSKFYFCHPFESGEQWAATLEAEHRLAYESASPFGALYQANIGLTNDDLQAFESTMLQQDVLISEQNADETITLQYSDETMKAFSLPDAVLTPREAFFAAGEWVLPDKAIERIAKQTVVHCPPGIPVLMPGERIQSRHLSLLPQDGLLVVR